jgi:hypothetical protein
MEFFNQMVMVSQHADMRSIGKTGCDDRISSVHTIDIVLLYGADPMIRDGGYPPPVFLN